MNPTSLNRVNYRQEAIRSLDRLPPFSPILHRLMASMANEDVSFNDLAAIIERDTVLTGYVLRLVNSAIYGRRGTINSVRHAVSIIGLAKLRNVVLGLSISQLWQRVNVPPSWNAKRFNLHSLAVGMLADQIAQNVEVDYAEGAFIAGLLHDIGILMIATAFPNEFQEIVRMQQLSDRSLCECEMAVLDLTHESLSALALDRWNLPLPVRQAAEFHHHPEDDPAQISGVGAEAGLPLSQVVFAANNTARRLGIRIFSEERLEPETDPSEFLVSLGLGEKAQQLLEEFQAEFDQIRSSF